MRTPPGRRPVAVVALALLVLTSCGSERPTDAGPAPSRVPDTDTSAPGSVPEEDGADGPEQPAAESTQPPRTTTVAVYLVKGETLEKVTRRVPRAVGIGRQAMEALLEGPTAAEVAAGVTTAIPAGTRLLGLVIEARTAAVDLSPAYESGGGTLGLTLRLAQVACTLDQFETVDGVRFSLAGEPVRVFSGDGIVLDSPVRCADYRDLRPQASPPPPPPPSAAGVVVQPGAAGPGQELVVTVSGFAPAALVVVELVRRVRHEPVITFQVRTDGAGRAEQRFLVPGATAPGSYSLVATSEDRSETASGRVTALPSSNCPPEQQPAC